ncbi:hypothetical protein [Paraburkholderia youngii]|uniref:Uncharacterized protein n=1 Tax=Paraburkholderia youngii TaxID=2782701 RepID=A0A7Y6JU68_9BURK|nr:hypothetical protein [Paraburkholderia youngii]NUX98794.1 hypothetical protein [Paraburkholderia youngii]
MIYVYADLCVDENDEYTAVPAEPLPDDTFSVWPVTDHVLAVWLWSEMTMH